MNPAHLVTKTRVIFLPLHPPVLPINVENYDRRDGDRSSCTSYSQAFAAVMLPVGIIGAKKVVHKLRPTSSQAIVFPSKSLFCQIFD
jgi:hypothetical protein